MWAAFAAMFLSIIGGVMSNNAKADQERAEKKYYDEQAKMAKEAALRNKSIFDTESKAFIGTQAGMFARAGVDLNGSALLRLADTKAQTAFEGNAILAEGSSTERLALMRAQRAKNNADLLSDPSYNLLQASGTMLNSYSNMSNAASKDTGSTKANLRTTNSGGKSGHFNVDPGAPY